MSVWPSNLILSHITDSIVCVHFLIRKPAVRQLSHCPAVTLELVGRRVPTPFQVHHLGLRLDVMHARVPAEDF